MADILIKNGLVYDGSGNEPFPADIGIEGDRIVFIGKATIQSKGSMTPLTTIDASGLSVAPGFIDTHAHSDFTVLADPRAEGKVFQGITTEINGNCGLSGAPLFGSALKQKRPDLKELGIKRRWTTLKEYLGLLDSVSLTINFATLVGHGNLRASVMGYEARCPTASEMKAMKELLRESIEAGAIGLSTGLIYPPGVFSETAELIELAISGREGSLTPLTPFIYTSHMRSEGSLLIEAIEEVIEIGRRVNDPLNVHISHIKTAGKSNWHKLHRAISLMESARARGIRLTCDRYPYIASSTDLDSVLPAWVLEGGSATAMKRLKSTAIRNKLRAEVLSQHPEEDYWQRVVVSTVSSAGNKWMEGKDIAKISCKLKMSPLDALLHILIEEKLRIGGIFHSMSEDNLKRLLGLPFVMVGSDSSACSTDGPTRKGRPHPRGFGSFPRFLGRYVRDSELMGMAEAIHKITGLPAKTFGLKKRGLIKKGFIADIVVFDDDKIIDKATYERPFRKAEGIVHVIVNGVPVLRDGETTGAGPGRVLRYGV